MGKFTIDIDDTTGYYGVIFDNVSLENIKQALAWVTAEIIIEKKLSEEVTIECVKLEGEYFTRELLKKVEKNSKFSNKHSQIEWRPFSSTVASHKYTCHSMS